MFTALLMLAQATTPAVSTATVSPAQISVARDTLESSLRDYQGSRFRGFREVRTGPLLALCGEANMRNGAGGFNGWSPLAIVIEGDALGPRLISVAPNGYTGLSDYTKVCVLHGPSGSAGPKGAVEGSEDLTPALQPVAS
jgi:hypothetical protein